MVAPTPGIVKRIVDGMAARLETVEGLRVYRYPAESVQEFPAAVIRDNRDPDRPAMAEYRSAPPSEVYHLEVLVLVQMGDDQEAYDELEKYISADSPSSVRALMAGLTVQGVQATECTGAEPRRKYRIGGADLWGCCFRVRHAAA